MILNPHQMGQQSGPRPPQHVPGQHMPTQPMPTQSSPGDDAEITQVVQPGVIPTVSNHRQTRNSLSQRLSGDM